MEFYLYTPGSLPWTLLHAATLHTLAVSFLQAALTMAACGCGLGLIHMSIHRGAHDET